MKYYQHESEDLEYGEGVSYQEIDWNRDLVVRQVDVYGDRYRWGLWNGSSLVGVISDQPPSSFQPPLSENEAISREEFERVWSRVVPAARRASQPAEG